MPIEFTCFPCSQKLRVPDECAGKRARCPTCRAVIDIPKHDERQTAVVIDDPDRIADVIDYEVFGHEMQYVEITLDPGEMAIADPDSLMYTTAGIEMATLSNEKPTEGSTLLEKMFAAGMKMFTGDSLSMASYFNVSEKQEVVAFAATTPGKLIPMHLDDLGGELICQRDSLLCAARGIEISLAAQHKSVGTVFGRQGYVLHRLKGDGIVVIHVGGTMMYRRLNEAETIKVEAGSLAAIAPSVKYELKMVPGVKSILGSDGILVATLTGPGDVWLQSLPQSRVAGRIMATTRGISPDIKDRKLGASPSDLD